MKKKRPINFLFISLSLSIFLTSCNGCNGKSDSKPNEKINLGIKIAESESEDEVKEINHVNFYFENSASMNGYLNGRNFKQTLHRIFGNIDENKLKPFFVNTEEYPTSDILNKIDNKQINVGQISNSDHEFIFANAINNTGDNNLSIVVTDGIYSVSGGDTDIVAIDIENHFKDALEKTNIETVVLRLSSEFNGTYYSEACEPGHKARKINQSRPYYILLFGSNQVINNALEQIVVRDDLPGFESEARFFITRNLNVEYTILTRGEEKRGSFKEENKRDLYVKTIVDVEKYELRGSERTKGEGNYLQFGIALDYSKLPLPGTYLRDTTNYSISGSNGYKVNSITDISELEKDSKTYEFLKFKFKDNMNFTHIVILKSTNDLYGDLRINLENNLPSWINDTSTGDDCVDDLEGKTWNFEQLMIGISNAYKEINNSNKYLDINIKVKS